MNGEQTMEDKIEYKSKTGHFWIDTERVAIRPDSRSAHVQSNR